MALRNITIPVAALLFATALAFTPAMAAPAGSGAGGNAGNQSSSGGGGSHSGGGGGSHASHSGGGRSGGFHSGGRATGGTHFAGHRSGGGSHRSHRSGGFFFGFGAPYPYYYGDDSTVVCRYRRVRSHRHWVRRRYCWRQYW